MTPTASHAEQLAPVNVRRTLEYLSRDPYANVFLSYLVVEAPPLLKRDLYVISDASTVIGVAFFGRQFILAGEPDALPAFAQIATDRDPQAIVGPHETVERFWQLAYRNHRRPRLVRSRQPVMMVDTASLRTTGSSVLVRPARDDEWKDVVENSAAMIAAELEMDPRTDPDFASSVQRMIRMRLWWVGEMDGRLCFYCNVGSWSPHTAQLQGIWTPPGLRRRGLATAALGAICRELLGIFPSLSLYVNDFNAPAIALYDRLGFKKIGELQTILL